MSNNYENIKHRLEPFKDKVFYCGLTEAEVLEIEQKIAKKFPIYFREFLKTFGVRQDFVFGLLTNENDFVKRTDYLPSNIRNSYVLVGDNGEEDFWLLNATDECDKNNYEWQHWLNGGIVKVGYDFEALLNESITKLSDKRIIRENNDKKNWCVQFSIPANNDQEIYSTIPLTITQKWELKEVSSAQVYCYETKAKLADQVVKFKRQEYAGWRSPMYYFDLKEPASQLGQQSLIKDIDTKLKNAFPRYRLIDYGILPPTDDEV